METEERRAQLGEELEGGGHLETGRIHRIESGRVPGPVEGAVPEDVRPRPHEAVPVADGHPQVVLHPPPGYHPVGVVPPEGQGVVALRARIGDPADAGEELVVPGHDGTPARWLRITASSRWACPH